MNTQVINLQRVWADVIKGIVRSHELEALSAKTKIEEAKREEERKRTETKTEWVPKLYVKQHLIPTEVSWVHCEWEYVLLKKTLIDTETHYRKSGTNTNNTGNA
jgi:hypothetical protein